MFVVLFVLHGAGFSRYLSCTCHAAVHAPNSLIGHLAVITLVLPVGSPVNDAMQKDIQEIKKILETRSEATRQASSISADDLEAVLTSLKCRVLSTQDEVSGKVEDVEYTWAANKYEPQQQEEYLKVLEKEACPVLQQHCVLVRQTCHDACHVLLLHNLCFNT